MNASISISKANPINDKNRAGQLASEPEYFGTGDRYKVAAVHTRFDSIQWFVWDTQEIDYDTSEPRIIAQDESYDTVTWMIYNRITRTNIKI